jgi:hypothetical protein
MSGEFDDFAEGESLSLIPYQVHGDITSDDVEQQDRLDLLA